MFEIEVVSEPSLRVQDKTGFIRNSDLAQLTRYDEALVKPALLFADKVRLITLRDDLAVYVKSSAFENSSMPVRYIGAFAKLSRDPRPEELAAIGFSSRDVATKEDADAFFAGDRMSAMDVFAAKYEERILAYQHAYAKVLRERRDALKSEQIAAAVDAGVLEVGRWGPADLDYHQLAWVDYREEYMPEAIDFVLQRLASSSGAVLLEPNARRIFARPGNLEVDQPQMHQNFETSVATLASVLTARLPGLTDMPVDEILDLRRDLAPYLAPFRSEMLVMAEEIGAADGGEPVDLAREAERKWVRDIAPALKDIDHLVRKGRYGRNLLAGLTADKATAGTALSSAVLAVGSTYAGLGALVPAAVAGAYPFVRALNESLQQRDEAKKNRLYFLYRAERAAARRGAS